MFVKLLKKVKFFAGLLAYFIGFIIWALVCYLVAKEIIVPIIKAVGA